MLKTRKNLAGQTFGKLLVLEQVEDYISPQGKHYSQWLCECSCSEKNKIVVPTNRLTCGITKSCGCLKKTRETNEAFVPNQYELNLEDEYGKYGVGYCKNSNLQFYFDMDDYDKIKNYSWRSEYMEQYHYTRVRAYSKEVRRYIQMHYIILGKNYDHIDRNALNNRKYNLRKATLQENAINRSIQRHNKSGVIGVYFENCTQKWRVYLESNGRKMYFGRYANKEDAIKARLKAEKEYFKEFAPQQHLYEQYNIQ